MDMMNLPQLIAAAHMRVRVKQNLEGKTEVGSMRTDNRKPTQIELTVAI
jgi:hypothetical protein